MTDYTWQPEHSDHFQRGLTVVADDEYFARNPPDDNSAPALREQYQGILVRKMVADLVTVANELGITPAELDDWVHDLHAAGAGINQVHEDEADEMLDIASLDASAINNDGLDSQLRYLLRAGAHPGSIMQNMALLSWELVEDESPDAASFADVIAAVEEDEDKPLKQFKDRKAFNDWFDTAFFYDAMDCAEGEIQPPDSRLVNAVYRYLEGKVMGGSHVLQSQPKLPKTAMSL